MCSIAGLIRVSNSNVEVSTQAAVERMIAVLGHRGPHDRGISHFELKDARGQDPQSRVHVTLGNTRLAIIDLSVAGHQPMHDENAGLTVTYNGEVYNFRELRAELGNEVGDWISKSDTEVVLRAYGKWGTGAFAKLRGMFAVAILDQGKRELVLARDRFGIKPLYYYVRSYKQNSDGQGVSGSSVQSGSDIELIFASEIRALLATEMVPKELDQEGLASYLRWGSVQAPLTIVRRVRSLIPGNCLRVSAVGGQLQIEELSFVSSPESAGQSATTVPSSRSDAVALLREYLEESVRAHLVSDVPLGVFLSGGMDSSALVALTKKVVSEPPMTFSVVFDEPEFSEAPHSRLVAEKFKTDHRELRLTEERLFGMVPTAIAALDQPTMDGVNTYAVSGAVKEAGVTVALSGLGGDELFAGYPTFRRALRMGSFSNFSKRLLRSASGIASRSAGVSVAQKKFWQLAASDGSPTAVYSITRQLFASDSIERLLENHQTNRNQNLLNVNPQLAMRKQRIATLGDPVNEISHLELQGYMANTLLRDTDCMSMAHSLEVRVPFVDAKIVSCVLSLPGNWKMNGSHRSHPKPLLADAVNDLLPPELLQRPKMGFMLPFERWMCSCLQKEISNALESETSVSAAGLNDDEVSSTWRRFLRTPNAVGWSRPWALYVLVRWCEINGVRSSDYTDLIGDPSSLAFSA